MLLLLGACGGGRELSVVLNADKAEGAAPLEVNFSALIPDAAASAGDNGVNEVGYSWDFDTGETVQGGSSRAYVFRQAGSFLVNVTATREGQTAQASVRVDVAAPPVAPTNNPPSVTLKTSRTTGKAPLEVTFSAAATDPNGDALSYSWNFGDGETATDAPNQTHTFTEAGAYTAVVTVADGRGGVAQAETRIAVTNPDPQVPPTAPPAAPKNQAPKVALSAKPTSGTAPLTVSLKADARDPEGEPLTYTWDFGNGKKVEGNSSRTLTYTEPGSYTAVVTVGDGLAETSAKLQLKVAAPAAAPPDNSPPDGSPPDNSPQNNPPEDVTATADPPSGTTPLEVEFSAAAEDPDDDTLVYLWDFGDGVISSENPARHTYQRAGSYTASVTVGDRQGGKARQEVEVVVSGGGPGTPDVPFYGEWAWAATAPDEETFTGYLSISEATSGEDSGLEDFFVRGGQGAWTYCKDGLDACGAPTGVGRIDVLNYGDGDTFTIVFSDRKTGAERLVAFDDDDRIGSRDGAPLFEGEGAWYYDDGRSDDLSFTMVKVANNPQTALDAALAALTTP